MKLTAFCGKHVLVAVSPESVPSIYPDCEKCIKAEPKVAWGAILPMRTARGKTAHYVLREKAGWKR